MDQCCNPIIAVSLFKNHEDKHVLKFLSHQELLNNSMMDLKNKYGSDNVFCLPCTKCENCRKNYSHEWALRCTLEASEHKHNYFVTLTYDDDSINYADDSDFRKFIDRLEKFDSSVKYFACREYGEVTNRLHYHVILFMDKDIELYKPVKLGSFFHYHSKIIDKKWTFGLTDVSPFATNCAAYVAKYTGKGSKCFMSRNLGKIYFYNHWQDIIDNNFQVYCLSNGTNHISSYVPSCFFKWFDEMYFDCSDSKLKRMLFQKKIVLDSLRAANTIREEDYIRARASSGLRKNKGVKKL